MSAQQKKETETMYWVSWRLARKDVGQEGGSDQRTISRQIDLSESIESEMVGDLAVERPSKTCGKIRARAATAIDKVRSHS
jgi:hypothetical protein